jgi:Rrf2 family cysteine metabolism transcriptional repressor
VPSARQVRRGRLLSPAGPADIQGIDRIVTVKNFHSGGAISFSTKGEYGVRLMVRLAARRGTGPISLGEIAAEEDLPRAYLEQLAIPLREAHLITSTRGARGGYEVARDPATIRMSEVLRALEGPLAPMICASEDPAHAPGCSREGACTVNHLWIKVRDAIADALDSVTLADLVPPSSLVEVRPIGAGEPEVAAV